MYHEFLSIVDVFQGLYIGINSLVEDIIQLVTPSWTDEHDTSMETPASSGVLMANGDMDER